MIERLQHKYALSEKGTKDMLRAFVAVTIANLVLMLPVGLLYYLASYLLEGDVPRAKIPFFTVSIIVVLILIAASTVFQYMSTFYSTYVESGVRRRTLAEKLRKIPLSFFGKKDLADLTNTIMSDCALLETASSHWIPELVGAIISTTLIVISLFFFDWRMALAAVWVMPVAFLIVLYSRKVMGKVYERTMQYRISCQDGIQEGLETLRDLRSYNMTDTYMSGLETKIKAVEKNAIFVEFTNAAFVCSAQMILKLGIGTVAVVGSVLLMNGQITVLTFFMFLLVVTRMYEPLQISLQNLSAIISADTNCKRMDEILSYEEQEGSEELTNDGYDIQFDHVSFAYNKKNDVLHDISFKIEPGETVAIMGPTGSGKTTLINLISRMYDTTSGKVSVDGVNVKMLKLEQLRKNIGVASQDVLLFSDTIDGNIAFGRSDMPEEEVYKYATLAAADDFIRKTSDGYDTIIGERGVGLSGGQKQRISLARALAVKPSVLILDDTTSAVDMETEKYIQNSLKNLDFECTKIIIAQRISSTKNADKIIILNNGSIEDIGTHEELIAKHGYYREVYDLQTN